MNRRDVLALVPASLATALPRAARAQQLPADAIFASAKAAWRSRNEAPFVTFNLRERYAWRDNTHDSWWSAAYRDGDRALVLRRMVVPEDEAQRLRGAPISLDLRWHHGLARADTVDTSGGADAFPVLDPLIDPNASFGLLAREQKAVLSGGVSLERQNATPSAAPIPLPEATAFATDSSLRELAHVEATSRDYAIAFAGIESVRGVDAYHLTLTPMRSPNVNRLRDLWVDPASFETLRLAVHGLFQGKPYADARWVVTYVRCAGRNYVQQIATSDTLRFGFDRFVAGLQFDFVAYDFPATIPPITFEHLL